MGGCRCSYKNCTNTTKSADGINFFQYPVKHRARCITWIENSEKRSFYDLEEEQLRNKVICEVHFEEKWFLNSQRKRLLHGAVPTLDGESNRVSGSTSPTSRDAPVYSASNQYNDVKVVPTNNDGTVFVLDTENMFTISPKIESYIIKNGVLVPTNSNSAVKSTTGRFIRQSTSNRFTKPSTSAAGYVMGAETEIANINTPPGPSKSLLKEKSHHSSFFKSEAIEPGHQTDNGDIFIHEEQLPEKKPEYVETRSKEKQGSATNSHGHSKSAVSKSYLRQIKKHSRDIASIKRMLKQKRIAQQTKPHIKTVLSELQQQVPSSLFTIIGLILGEKNDLNGEDIEFFTTLHRASPEVYQMLSDKYKWNLPSIELVVDTTTEPYSN